MTTTAAIPPSPPVRGTQHLWRPGRSPAARHPLADDLNHILAHTEGLWEELKGKRLFLTGGTGFVGTWLLESFAWANEHQDLKASACILTRNPTAFQQRHPGLAENPAIQLHSGSGSSFTFPPGEFSHMIHAATENDSAVNPLDPVEHFDANVRATQRVLEFARQCGAQRFLFTSSGAVYGKQPPELPHLSEAYPGAPATNDPTTAYAQSKRASEFLCAALAKQSGIAISIARLFAFVGPHLKLDANFAIGNFIRDALRGQPIHIQGDGTSYRSYLYAADLAVWIWTILLRGQSGRAYNVGSDRSVSILQLAQTVCKVVAPGTAVVTAHQADPTRLAARYLPAIGRAREELGLNVWVGLSEAIGKTAQWHRYIQS